MKKHFYLIDTSAILSGKPLSFPDGEMVTTPEISNEFQPGGRDYRTFQLLQEKGLTLQQPTKQTMNHIKSKASELGETNRLSTTDISLLALAHELMQNPENKILLLTDDYAIQNLAAHIGIPFSPISQRGITKKFKWTTRCPGCRKLFTDAPAICPICGTKTQFSSHKQGRIKKS